MRRRDGRYPPAAALTAEPATIAAAVGPAHDHPSPGGASGRARARSGRPPGRPRRRPLAALVADGPAPPGFAGRLAAARAALLRKRAREAAELWPLLAAAPDRPGVFAGHRDGPEPVGPLRDGWEVARALRARGELGPGGAAELDERESALHYDSLREPRRRSAAGRFAARFQGRR